MCTAAIGLHDIEPSKRFRITMSSFSDQPMHIPQHTRVALASPTNIVVLCIRDVDTIMCADTASTNTQSSDTAYAPLARQRRLCVTSRAPDAPADAQAPIERAADKRPTNSPVRHQLCAGRSLRRPSDFCKGRRQVRQPQPAPRVAHAPTPP